MSNYLVWESFRLWCITRDIQLSDVQSEIVHRILYNNELSVNFITGRGGGKTFLALKLAEFLPHRFKIIVPNYERQQAYRTIRGIESFTPYEVRGRSFDTVIFDDYEELLSLSSIHALDHIKSHSNQELVMIYGHNPRDTKSEEAGEWDE